MGVVGRLLLVWFLVVALPLKGFAAVNQHGCGPGHHGSKVAVVSVGTDLHPDAAHADAVSPERAAGHHADMREAGEAVSTVSDGAGSALSQPDTPKGATLKMKCGVCAPCAVAAPAFEPATVPQPPPGASVATHDGTPYAGVVGEVPHRPPR